MLIMTRKPSETIMINDNVSVTVLGIKGNQVRVGINAPKHIAVHREEIYLRIQEEGNHKPVDAPLDLITERLRLLDDADSEEYQLLYKLHSLLS